LKNTGKILVLAFPDTFVTMSTEFICRILPLVGLGTKEYIKAGHAALVLIENETGKVEYFDFGRYVTPKGHGRVRSANTDAELKVPFTAKINESGTLENLNDILLWLNANPKKTHGEGRLLASICNGIDHELAREYILQLQDRGSVPYGAFDKTGSNCARFVTDTIIAATDEKAIIKALKINKIFTPSTVGNVEKAASEKKVYQVVNGKIETFKGSALNENLKNYFDKDKPAIDTTTVVDKPCLTTIRSSVQKLEGTGCSAWFELTNEPTLPKNQYRIRRYNEDHALDFDGIYVSNTFDLSKEYTFTYNSHCAFCHVLQEGTIIKLDNIGEFSAINLQQKVHSA